MQSLEISAFCIDIFTSLLGLIFLFLSIKKFKKNKIFLINFVIYFLFFLPLLLDLTISKPDYGLTPYYGYSLSYNNPVVRITYDLCILFFLISAYFIFLYNRKINFEDVISDNLECVFKIILFIMLIIGPLIGLMFFENKLIIFNFGWRYSYDQGKIPPLTGYASAEKLSYFAVLSACIIFFLNWKTKKNKILAFIFTVFFLYLNICIEGKRSIIAYFLICILICLIIYWCTHKIRKRAIFIGSFFCLSLIVAFFTMNHFFRNSSPNFDFIRTYTNLRIDIFRDQTLKFAIYSKIYPNDTPYIRFPGESYLTSFAFFPPFTWISSIPKLGYETYLTSGIFMSSIEDLGRTRVTCSFFDELFSNFSFFALFLVAIIFLIFDHIFCKSNFVEKCFLLITFVMMCMYSFAYMSWFFLALLLFYLIDLLDKMKPNIYLVSLIYIKRMIRKLNNSHMIESERDNFKI